MGEEASPTPFERWFSCMGKKPKSRLGDDMPKSAEELASREEELQKKREEAERKARRGEIDPTHEFTIQVGHFRHFWDVDVVN